MACPCQLDNHALISRRILVVMVEVWPGSALSELVTVSKCAIMVVDIMAVIIRVDSHGIDP